MRFSGAAVLLSLVLMCSAVHIVQGEYEHIAKRMQSMIDTDVDPCQDFYRYACGKINVRFVLLLRRNAYEELLQTSSNDPGTFQQLETHALQILSQALIRLKNETDNPKRIVPLQQLKIAYSACRNALPDLGKADSAEGFNYIIDELGGWPTMNKNWETEAPKSKTPFALAVMRRLKITEIGFGSHSGCNDGQTSVSSLFHCSWHSHRKRECLSARMPSAARAARYCGKRRRTV